MMKSAMKNGRIVAVANAKPDSFDRAIESVKRAVNALAAFCDAAPWMCFCSRPPTMGIEGDVCPVCGTGRMRVRQVLWEYLGLSAGEVPWIQERLISGMEQLSIDDGVEIKERTHV